LISRFLLALYLPVFCLFFLFFSLGLEKCDWKVILDVLRAFCVHLACVLRRPPFFFWRWLDPCRGRLQDGESGVLFLLVTQRTHTLTPTSNGTNIAAHYLPVSVGPRLACRSAAPRDPLSVNRGFSVFFLLFLILNVPLRPILCHYLSTFAADSSQG
jgi:hypothetical protein